MPWPVTINGHTYAESDFGPYSYVVNFPAILQDVSNVAIATAIKAGVVDTKHAEVVANAATVATSKDTAVAAAAVAAPALGLIADSTTSLAIATGDKTFTVPSGKNFVAGMPARASSKANADTQAMIGTVKSYSGTTLVINVTSVVGSATRADWTIAVTGGALAPVGAGQDAQAVARYAEIMDGLRAAAVPDKPNILLDFLSSTFFVRGIFLGASLAALIAATPGSTFTRSTSATYFDAGGVMRTAAAGEPRFDYDPVTKQPLGLLLEPAATNLFINSEDWSGSFFNATVTTNALSGPDGLATMDLITENTATNEHFAADRSMSVTAGTTYCFSMVVAAPASWRYPTLRIATGTNITATFNPTTGALHTSSGTGIVSTGSRALGGGLFRIWLVFTAQATGTSVFRTQLNYGGAGSYTGDGVSGCYVGYGQVEVGTTPTSYIATGASAVTRTADSFRLAVASLIPLTTGTLYVEYTSAVPPASNNVPLHLGDDASQNSLYFGRNAAGSNSGAIILSAGGVNYVSSTGNMGWPGDGIARAALRYAAGDVAWAWGGIIAGTNNTFNSLTALDRIASVVNAPCYLRRAEIVPSALSNAKLLALTTAANWS